MQMLSVVILFLSLNKKQYKMVFTIGYKRFYFVAKRCSTILTDL